MLLRTATATIAIVLHLAAPAAGQAIPFSQHAVVSQTVGVTVMTITYNRPTARGRTLFGATGVVKWDRIWHPGADSASRIEFTRPVSIDGHAIPAGEYSLWLIPRESSAWTLILSRAARVFHQPYPGEEFDLARVEVPPEQGPHMDALAYYFPTVGRDSTILRIHWGTTVLPIRIRAPLDP